LRGRRDKKKKKRNRAPRPKNKCGRENRDVGGGVKRRRRSERRREKILRKKKRRGGRKLDWKKKIATKGGKEGRISHEKGNVGERISFNYAGRRRRVEERFVDGDRGRLNKGPQVNEKEGEIQE